jgi:hypothetical protein
MISNAAPTTILTAAAPLPDSACMSMSDSIDQLAGALAAAQGTFAPVGKNSVNPHFKSRYADLASLIEATRPALHAAGLALVQSPSLQGGRVIVTSRLIHKSGQWIENSVSLKAAQDTPQAMGSTITYGRRYGLSALLNICADEDDDGNAGSKRG